MLVNLIVIVKPLIYFRVRLGTLIKMILKNTNYM